MVDDTFHAQFLSLMVNVPYWLLVALLSQPWKAAVRLYHGFIKPHQSSKGSFSKFLHLIYDKKVDAVELLKDLQ